MKPDVQLITGQGALQLYMQHEYLVLSIRLLHHRVLRRAEIVGEKTFGKGVVQYYFPMTDGSGIKLTIAKYLTPGHFDITQSGGLMPDHACSDFPHGDRVTPENDTCIQEALRLIGQ